MRSDLRELVRKTVEDTLNGLLEEEAGDLVGAERHERTAGREAYLAGRCGRNLTMSSGEVTILMPKLKGTRFTTAVIERCRRRETSVEEAMVEMCLAGVSTRRIEDASELEASKPGEAAKVVREGYAETLACTRFTREHWRRIGASNAIEHLNREVRRRTRAVSAFPDGRFALMLVAARLKCVAEGEWGSRRYLDVTLLEEAHREAGP